MQEGELPVSDILSRLKENKLWTESNGNQFYTVDKFDYKWLLIQAERNKHLQSLLTELLCAVYEHAYPGTELMEIAERIDDIDW